MNATPNLGYTDRNESCAEFDPIATINEQRRRAGQQDIQDPRQFVFEVICADADAETEAFLRGN